MLELWLVRHAESEGNISGTHDDTPLSVLGRRQAASLKTVLAGVSFDAVFSSDLIRCVETAALALPGLTPQQDLRLRETQEGPKECFVDLGKLSSQEMLAFLQQNAAPAGESGLAFRARVKDWLDALPAQGKLLAFTHTLVIREILRLRLAPGGSRAHHPIDNASLTRLEFNDQETRVLSLNETSHLK
jgi:broad specificity phosphatase PhoE